MLAVLSLASFAYALQAEALSPSVPPSKQQSTLFNLVTSHQDVGDPCKQLLATECSAESIALSVLQDGKNCSAELEGLEKTGSLSAACCNVSTTAFECWATASNKGTSCSEVEHSALVYIRDIVAKNYCNPCQNLINKECSKELAAILKSVNGVDCLPELYDIAEPGEFAPVCCRTAIAYLDCGVAAGGKASECDKSNLTRDYGLGSGVLKIGVCASTPTPDCSLCAASATGTATSTCTPATDDGCFPSSATVLLEDGRQKTMSELEVGDSVQAGPKVFSEVFFFGHRKRDSNFAFVRIMTNTRTEISLSPNHYVRTGNGGLVAAGLIQRGDLVELGDGTRTTVTKVDRVSTSGLYNPHTLSGEIVVNGVAVSCYTTTLHPTIAHALLAPLRWLYMMGLGSVPLLDNGAGALVRHLPTGPSSG